MIGIGMSGRVRTALVASGLVAMLAVAAPAAAARPEHARGGRDQATVGVSAHVEGEHTLKARGLNGIVVAKSDTDKTFTVYRNAHGGTETVVKLADDASAPGEKGQGKGRGKSKAVFVTDLADIQVGQRVVVRGQAAADGKTFEATWVLVKPAKKTTVTVGTQVGALSGDTLTVKPATGDAKTFTLSSETEIRPEGKTRDDLKADAKLIVASKDDEVKWVIVRP